jgi:DHA2 family multidrug resistance protein-like MFS transporter
MLAIANQEMTRATKREWIGLLVIALLCVLYSMDLTVLNLAIPRLSEALRPSSAQLLWIVDIYGFVLAGLLVPMGALGDRFGRRKVLLIGAGAFGAASIVAAFSDTAATLIAARAVLGVAGATIAPSTLSLIRNMFHDDKQRSVAIGVWITSFSIGGAVGPVIGGVLLQHFWWGSVFLLSVPVMVLLLVVGPMLLPEYREQNARPIDVTSVVLSLAGVLSVIYGVKRAATVTDVALPIVAVAIGVCCAIAFVGRQQRICDPLIDPALFKNPKLVAALVAYTLATFISFGMYLFTGQYLQLVKGLSPLVAGLVSLPAFAGFVLGSFISPVVARRTGSERLMIAGFLGSTIGFGLLGMATVDSSLALIIAAISIYSLSLSPVFVLATDLIVGNATAERAGAASALSETGSELGGALGIGLLGSLGTAIYRHAVTLGMPSGIPRVVADHARNTIGGAMGNVNHLTVSAASDLHYVAQNAFTASVNAVGWSCALLALSMAIALACSRRLTRDSTVRRVSSTRAESASLEQAAMGF